MALPPSFIQWTPDGHLLHAGQQSDPALNWPKKERGGGKAEHKAARGRAGRGQAVQGGIAREPSLGVRLSGKVTAPLPGSKVRALGDSQAGFQVLRSSRKRGENVTRELWFCSSQAVCPTKAAIMPLLLAVCSPSRSFTETQAWGGVLCS